MRTKEPVENIRWIPCDKLTANHYNPNRVMNAEMNLIEKSILRTGWIQPVLVNRNYQIIDGFHRWTLSRLSPSLRAKYDGKVPCAVLDISDAEAMLITVRINRAKGTHLAFRMADYVKELVEKHKMPLEDIAEGIGATLDEVLLLMKSDVFEQKDVKNWAYSEAWFPAESKVASQNPSLFDYAVGEVDRTKKSRKKKDPDEEEDDEEEPLR